MKTSQLIELLQRSLAEEGDLPVDMWGDDSDAPAAIFGVCVGRDGDTSVSLTICGPETMYAFT